MGKEETAMAGAKESGDALTPPPDPAPAPAPAPARDLYSLSFWDSEFRETRKILGKTLALPLLYTSLLMWACLSLYWGSLLPNNNLRKLQVYAVDLDGGFLGKQIISGIQESIATMPNHLNWRFDTSITRDALSRDLLTDQRAWGVVQVSPNASSSLDNALQHGVASYNPLSAVTIYYLSARNQITTSSKVVPAILAAVNPLLTKASIAHTATFLGQNAGNESVLRTAGACPQCLASPFAASQEDLLAFDSPTAMGTTMVGLIFLLTFTFSIFQLLHANALIIGAKLNIRSALFFRTFNALLAYFFLSLWYSLINLAFKVPVTRHYGGGGFILFWLLNFCTMTSVGLPMESIFTFLGVQWAGYFLPFWIIVNVAGSFTSFELMPGFYKFGYAFPFYHAIEGTRTIVFGTKNHLGRNFGVLLAWTVLGLIGIFVLTVWQLKRNQRKGTHALP